MIRTHELREKLLDMKSRLTWRQIVDELYPSELDKNYVRVVLYRIASDNYDPVNNYLRVRLGLVRRYIVYDCPRCGIPHTAPCGKVAKPPAIPRNVAPRPRRAINLSDPASAAATIRAHAGQEFVAELVRLLEE